MGQLVRPFRSSCLWLVGTVVGQLVKPFRLICPWMLGYGADGIVKLSRTWIVCMWCRKEGRKSLKHQPSNKNCSSE